MSRSGPKLPTRDVRKSVAIGGKQTHVSIDGNDAVDPKQTLFIPISC